MPSINTLKSLDLLQSKSNTTVIYFSNKRTDLHFDRFLYLAREKQQVFERYEDFCIAAGKPVASMITAEGSAPPGEIKEI
jgi:predicted nicotinamide N-methyase